VQEFIEARERVDTDDHARMTALTSGRGKPYSQPGPQAEQNTRSDRTACDLDRVFLRPDIPFVSNDAAREKFKAYLATKGLRVTNQRLAIFEAAFAQPEHFTAEELLVFARAIDDSVSRATVYRTLPIMIESALLREVDIGKNLKYYRPNADNKTQVAQVICMDCDKIFEISAPFMEWYGSSVSSKLNLTPVSQRLQVSAHCNTLRQTGTCKNRT
jgi:Fur family ferric uptake transcriptional regulator